MAALVTRRGSRSVALCLQPATLQCFLRSFTSASTIGKGLVEHTRSGSSVLVRDLHAGNHIPFLFRRTQTSAAIGAHVGAETLRETRGAWIGKTWSSASLLAAARHYGKCYYELSKTRLSLLVVTTASAGFVMGSGDVVDTGGLLYTSAGTMMAAASANAFNQIMEVKNDAAMKRTMQRPLPAGRMGRSHALIWAVGMGVSGVTLLAYQTNNLTAGLGAANIGLYALAYTPLKQLHPVNTWVGAVVGAIPPLMGWAAAAGQLDPGAYVLAGALYFWQLPHFMALAWLCRKDYAAGGYKMLSMVDATGRRTAAAALRNCVYLAPLGFLAAHWGTTSEPFAYENLVLTAGMGVAALAFYRQPSSEMARRLFRSSLLYLPILMTAMLVHRLPNPNAHGQHLKPRAPLGVEAEEEQGTMQRPGGRHEHVLDVEGSRDRIQESLIGQQPEDRRRLDWRGELLPRHAPLPPVAFMSAAPFPFLPLPDYGMR